MTHQIDPLHLVPLENRFSSPDGDGVTVGQIFSALTRRWPVLVSTILIITVLGYAVVKSLTPTYTSTSIIVLSARQDSVVDLQEPYMHAAASDALIRSESDALRSRTLVNRVIDRENLMADPEFNVFIRPVQPDFLTRWAVAPHLPKFMQRILRNAPPDPGT
jgi:uncharacterized protein involved in exopolysaccharide biosynthesis